MACPSATDRAGSTATFTSACSLCPNHRALTSETSSTPRTSRAARRGRAWCLRAPQRTQLPGSGRGRQLARPPGLRGSLDPPRLRGRAPPLPAEGRAGPGTRGRRLRPPSDRALRHAGGRPFHHVWGRKGGRRLPAAPLLAYPRPLQGVRRLVHLGRRRARHRGLRRRRDAPTRRQRQADSRCNLRDAGPPRGLLHTPARRHTSGAAKRLPKGGPRAHPRRRRHLEGRRRPARDTGGARIPTLTRSLRAILISAVATVATTLIVVLITYLAFPVTGIRVEGARMYPKSEVPAA